MHGWAEALGYAVFAFLLFDPSVYQGYARFSRFHRLRVRQQKLHRLRGRTRQIKYQLRLISILPSV